MTAPRRNEVLVIKDLRKQFEHLAAFRRSLQTDLTLSISPAQACRIAEYELRTGTKIEPVLLDLLDDLIFDTNRSKGFGFVEMASGEEADAAGQQHQPPVVLRRQA